MIRVVRGALVDRTEEAVLRPVRADLAPLTAASRDLWLRAGAPADERLQAGGALPVGGAVLTPGGDLPASFVIHAVVSAPDEPQTPDTVRRALQNGLRRAADWGVASLALPPLGIGAGTMDAEAEARGLVRVLAEHLAEGLPPDDIAIVVGTVYEEEILRRIVEAVGPG